jgi:type I restriction enzyme M protein
MLDGTTKHKIDSLRDTLVGVLPVPTQQVEQITLALLFKFMYDLDERNVELGGERQFFTGKYKQYGWHSIMDSKLSGAERVARYGEALEKMSQNPKLPDLFIQIFSRAYLPFRNAQTLNLFLQQIDDFKYEHSEDLGDAFEYLLKVMGSQGDAGQFRTPRHIIDFIIDAVEPTKEMRILDPACGTAGFLISAYKFILDQYKDEKGRPGAKLTSSEKKKLARNFSGYDISHDMVRLALVNMYLHGIAEPNINEYDTLTSEERWNEKAECIFANPPFMSPSGGIRPHSRFGIKATRSEVLFVDYIAEHITSDGRAGIIVPEGIIFQSANAYKDLRKQLIEDYGLYAVVSLPAGVFQPYSGVKTSILLLDKSFVKENEDILFVKIENDGYDLGAQRRATPEKNDLPNALELIKAYKAGKDISLTKSSLIISKEKIAASGDCNLSMDRYREQVVTGKQQWPMVKLGDVCEIISGQSPSSDNYNVKGQGLPFYQGKTEFGDTYLEHPRKWTTEITKIAEPSDILISVRAPVGPVNITKEKICIGRGLAAIRSKEQINSIYIFNILLAIQDKIKSLSTGSTFESINRNDLAKLQIPLPPLSVQEELVTELERYRKMIEGARAIIANYKPEIEIDPKWEMKELGEVCEFINGRPFKPSDWDTKDNGGLPIIRIQNLNNLEAEFNYYSGEVSDKYVVSNRELLFSWSGSRGSSFGPHIWVGKEAILNQHIFKVKFKPILDKMYLYYILKRAVSEVEENLHGGVGLVHITKPNLERIKIPIPDISTQMNVLARLELERSEIEMLKAMTKRLEDQIREKVARLWE